MASLRLIHLIWRLEPSAQVHNITALPPSGRRPSGTGQVAGNAPSPPAALRAEARATTGIAGVQQSKRAREQQEADRFDRDILSSSVRTVSGKTFYLREGVWTDAEFKLEARLPETSMRFGSDDYFALLKQKPRLADFFALGERIVVVLEGRVYRVTAGQ